MNNALKELQQILVLPKYPKVIEAYDISNLGDQYAVGAKISFLEGKPWKMHYRKFHIKTVEKQNDFAMIKEVLTRSLNRKAEYYPDLILIDGGKGQLSQAQEVLSMQKIYLPLVGLAKKQETLIKPISFEEIHLPFNHPSLRVLIHARNEVHRFVNHFHQKTRHRNTIKSSFDCIEGIGVKRKTLLHLHFKDIDHIKQASMEEIATKTKIPIKIIEKMKKNL